MVGAVVFDLYNTLIYVTEYRRPYTRLFAELGLQPAEIEVAHNIAGTRDFAQFSDYVQKIKPGHGIDLSSYEADFAAERATAAFYPETLAVLEELKSRHIKMGVISNLASPYKRQFYGLKLDYYFKHVLFSCDVGMTKPDKRIFLKMLELLKVNPQDAIMVGDKLEADVNGPRAVGMQAVHLDRESGSPGSITTLEGILQFV